uniref:Putative transcriptional adapter ADA2b isoform X1 n=1 Tax=Davidia involucrata TaxID=16924 RepID=A0A5B7BYR5_DAVIN
MAQVKGGPDSIKVEDNLSDKSFGGKKPKSSRDEGPSLVEFSGYNPKRQEFDPEYDNDAEQLLAEMEFKDIDTEEEHELKLRVLRIYSKRLDERKRRKGFILERTCYIQILLRRGYLLKRRNYAGVTMSSCVFIPKRSMKTCLKLLFQSIEF